MQTVQQGDRIQIHYVKRFQDGSMTSSRHRAPIELTVGVDHPRLPGLGLALVGLSTGSSLTVRVPAERAYGKSDSTRVHRWSRTRFPVGVALPIGKWVRMLNRHGRPRLVRILSIRGEMVLVDTNHRWAGLAMDVEIELVSIRPVEAALKTDDPRD